jgi:hypothetical protein
MNKSEVEALRLCITKLDSALDDLMKNEVVTSDLEIKRMVGSISAEFAAFLEIKLLPKLRIKFPGFQEI